MTRPLGAIALAFVMCSPVLAQGRDAVWARSMLTKATSAYENFAVEKALVFLDSAMLGKDLLATAEVASAHKYMGAGHAVMARTDQAIDHFIEALKLDETISLDPARFSETEMVPFFAARKRWLAEMDPNSSLLMMQKLNLAKMRIGSKTPGAALIVNGAPLGPLGNARYYVVPAGDRVYVSIRAKNCSERWDSTLFMRPGVEITVGNRQLDSCR